MGFSDSQLEQLYGDLAPDLSSSVAPAEAMEDETVPFRRLKQVANILPKGVNSLVEGAIGIGEMMRPGVGMEDLEDYKKPAPFFDTGKSEGLLDVALEKIAPEIAGWMIPYLGATKLGKVAGVNRVLTEGLAQGSANFVMGAKEEYHGDPGISAGVGFGSGVLQAGLPRWQRLLPLAAVSAVGEGAGNENWIGAGANFAFNMLPGQFKGATLGSVTEPSLRLDRFGKPAATIAEADMSHIDTSGLKLASGPIPAPVRTGIPFVSDPSTAHLNLARTGELQQMDLPMFHGEQVQPPIRYGSTVDPGEFRFMEDVSVRNPETPHPDLFEPTGLRLGNSRSTAEQLLLRDMQPSGLRLGLHPKIPRPSSTMDDVGTAGLRLDRPLEQGEFPLIKLQAEGTLNPDAPKFVMLQNEAPVVAEGGRLTSELADWRGHRVSRDLHLALEDVKPPKPFAESTPANPVEPTPPPPPAPKKAKGKAKVKDTPAAASVVDPVVGVGTKVTDISEIPKKATARDLVKIANDLGLPEREIYALEGGPLPKNALRSYIELALEKAKAKPVEIPQPKLADLTPKERTALRLQKGKADKQQRLQEQAKKEAHAKGEAYVKRGDKFETEGGYVVELPNGVTKKMFRDPESKWWYRDFDEGEPNSHYTERTLSTETKKDAVAALMKQFGGKAKTETPPVVVPQADPIPTQTVPYVMNPAGDLTNLKPRQQGPHIISTVLDEGDGIILSGNKWNAPHQESKGGVASIFSEHLDTSTGLGKSAFLIQDENGLIRVTQDRVEAARIAEMAGQRKEGTKGALQAHDLKEGVVKEQPKTVEQHRVAEGVEDAQQMAAAKKELELWDKLRDDLKFAVEEGDDLAARGLRLAMGKMRRKNSALEGSITPHTLAVLGAAGIAGLVTYQQTKGDMGATIAGALIVAGLAVGGAKAFAHLKDVKGPEVGIPKAPKLPAEIIAEKLDQLALETVRTPAGLAVGGRGGIVNSALLGAEDFFGLNRLQFYKDIKVKAGGFVDEVLRQQMIALKAVKNVKPSDSFAEATGRYLRGQLNDPAEVQRLLNSGGIISSEGGAWSRLTATEKAKYPEKWMQLDDQLNTNTKGEEVTIWHVINSVKQQLLAGEQAALTRLATNADDLRFAEYAFKTRTNFDVLMQTVHAAAGPKEARRLIGTMGQYVTRSHALITDPKFYPDAATIQKAMDNLASHKTDEFLSSVDAGRYAPAPGAPSATITVGGTRYTVSADAARMWENLYTPESLRAVVTQQIKEVKSYGESVKNGIISNDESQLQAGLFTGRKEIDAVRQALLGTHAAPQEMIRSTFNKLLPAAHSAHAMLGLTAAEEASGLAGRYASDIDYNAAIRNLRDQLPLAPDARAARAIQNKLNELANYLPISHDNAGMGLFQGSFVSRHVYSQLDEITSPFGFLDGYMGRGLQQFNNLFKETHLVWNPVTQARNAVQIPFMLVIGRAAHDLQAIHTAYNVVFKGENTAIAKWVTENGALSGNPVKGEFNYDMRELLDGTADNQIWNLFSKTRQFLHSAYAKPDDFVRTSVFIAAARREAAARGVAESVMHLDEGVTNAARAFMNRRAMDYGNVPKWVKAGRQIPLLSPFLTYSHEIVRITKNMAVDAAKGDLVSAAGLAGLATFPFLAQKYAEDSLSSVDRKDWEKGKGAVLDYSRPRFKLPMSRNTDGSFNYYDITPLMPFGDYLMMGRAAVDGDFKSLAAVNPIAGVEKSPFLNLAAAQVTGKDIHTQREFRDSWDRAKNVLQSVMPPLTPGIGNDYAKIAPEILGGQLGTTNVKTGRTHTIKGALLRNFTGLDQSQINPDMAVQTMIRIAQHDVANERQYLNDVMRSQGISEESRQRAIRRYAEAVRSITDQLHSRMTPQ